MRPSRQAKAAGVEGIVIALLHAYRNPEHEQAVKAIVRAREPEMSVFCSSEVWPIIREYERTMTAVMSGYVQPRVALLSLLAAGRPQATQVSRRSRASRNRTAA